MFGELVAAFEVSLSSNTQIHTRLPFFNITITVKLRDIECLLLLQYFYVGRKTFPYIGFGTTYNDGGVFLITRSELELDVPIYFPKKCSPV